MRATVTLIGVLLLPTAVGYAVVGSGRAWRLIGRLADARAEARPVPAAQPIERLAADARRLRAQLVELEGAEPAPGRGLRLRALRRAYLDALGAACVALEAPPPDQGSAGSAEIYRVEADLRRRGLEVRGGVVGGRSAGGHDAG
ncbi:MAG: hypothetical protein ACJ74O_02460 [Frankiaceae bacterium]